MRKKEKREEKKKGKHKSSFVPVCELVLVSSFECRQTLKQLTEEKTTTQREVESCNKQVLEGQTSQKSEYSAEHSPGNYL